MTIAPDVLMMSERCMAGLLWSLCVSTKVAPQTVLIIHIKPYHYVRLSHSHEIKG